MNSWDQLLGFIKGGKVIPILGPELLTVQVDGQSIPLYSYLAQLLARELGVDTAGIASPPTLNNVACKYLEARFASPATIYLALHAILTRENVAIPETLKKLALIKPLRLFVSTTVDSLLLQALNAQRYGGVERTVSRIYTTNGDIDKIDLPRDYRKSKAVLVYQLFGKISEDPDYAVTEEDTLEFVAALQTEERRPNRLFDEFRGNHLLLIGNSFPDWLARFFVRVMRGERLSAATKIQYFADDETRHDQNLIFFLQNFGGAQMAIFRDATPVQFVDELAERWRARYPEEWGPANPDEVAAAVDPPVGTADPNLSDDDCPDLEYQSIFISYARENEVPARLIADTLQEAGMKIWFDRVRINPAENWERKIRRNISNCSLFLPIHSAQTVERREGVFWREWLWAIQRAERMGPDEVFIVPIPIDNARVDDRFCHLHYELCPEGKIDSKFVRWIKKVMIDIEKRKRKA